MDKLKKKSKGKQDTPNKNVQTKVKSSIGPALVQKTLFAAVPRTPPPTIDAETRGSYDLELTGGTGILSASLLGHMFSTPPPDDCLTEETDTSLYDYEQARGTMSFSGAEGSIRNENRPRLQPPEFDDYEVAKAMHNADLYSEVIRVEPQIQALKSAPINKSLRRVLHESDEDTPPPSSSLRRFRQEDIADLRGSTRSSKRSSIRSRQLEAEIESQMLGRQSASPQRSLERSTRDLSRSASLKSLKEKQSVLLSKQTTLESEQQRLEEKLLDKLSQADIHDAEANNLMEASMRSSRSISQNYEARIKVLEDEKRSLKCLIEELQEELDCVNRRDSIVGDEEITLLKKQMQDQKDESTVLRSKIQRLNSELSKYQVKFRPLSDKEINEQQGLPSRGPKPSWLLTTKYLAPLFVAYDDRIAEKDSLIRQYERDVEMFCKKIEDILKENHRLHMRIEQTDVSGPNSMTEWRQLQEQCKLVLEENQLLMEQLDIQHEKQKEQHISHTHNVKQLSSQLSAANQEREHLEHQLEEMQCEILRTKKKYDLTLETNISKDKQDNYKETNRELEAENNMYREKLRNLENTLETLSSEKRSLLIQVDDLKVQNKALSGDIKAMYKEQRKMHRKVLLLSKALEDSEKMENTAEHYLSSVVKMATKTEHERDTYAHAAHKESKQKAKVINRLLEENTLVVKMEEKLKLYKIKIAEKLEQCQDQLKEKDEDFNNKRKQLEREIMHLRLLLRERDEMFESINGEKKQVEDDLETMWSLASKDNRIMKETLKSSLKRLQQYENNVIIEEDDELTKLNDFENVSSK